RRSSDLEELLHVELAPRLTDPRHRVPVDVAVEVVRSVGLTEDADRLDAQIPQCGGRADLRDHVRRRALRAGLALTVVDERPRPALSGLRRAVLDFAARSDR